MTRMAASYIGKKGSIRLYDSTATPYYLELVYEQMDFRGPLGRARPEEIAVYDRNNLNANWHYVQGSDAPIAEPIEISYSVRIDDTNMRQALRDALDIDQPATWTVNGDTWTTTKGDTSLTAGDGTSVTTPAFSDTKKRCTTLEILWDEGASDIGLQYAECYYPPDRQEISEAEDSLIVSVTAMVYGTITEITAFTTGTASTP